MHEMHKSVKWRKDRKKPTIKIHLAKRRHKPGRKHAKSVAKIRDEWTRARASPRKFEAGRAGPSSAATGQI
jgi:hypothetical protein